MVRRRRWREQARSGFWVFLLCLLSVALAVAVTDRYIYHMERGRQELREELARLRPEVADLRRVQARSRAIAQHLDPDLDPLEVYSELHRIVPGQIALTQLEYKYTPGRGGTIFLKGQSRSMGKPAELVDALIRSPLFSQVRSPLTAQRNIKGTTVYDFHINAVLGKSGDR